jgi:iron complex outermembrane recepter protein
MKKISLLFFLFQFSLIFAQKNISGFVYDDTGAPLIGVNVVEKGTSNGVTTDFNGKYLISVKEDAILVFGYVGFSSVERNTANNTKIDVTMTTGQELQEVQIVGSRSLKRSSTDTAVPVDIINMSEVVTKTGQIEVNQLLQYLAPSFNASKQSGSDGADHIDPATLRGLGPDQTLVLINGKRRHQSSLVNLYGTRGRGNTGTDLNAIPAVAIKRIEVLRDGAAAQYGSDAIAGVINIVLKDNVEEFNGNVVYGAFNANYPNGDDITSSGFDGSTVQFNGNYGFKIKENGFINATVDLFKKDHTDRPANPDKYDIYRERFGDAQAKSGALFLNGQYNLSQDSKLYFFGGSSLRDSDAFAFTRTADSPRNIPAIYPNGFNPVIGALISDHSFSAGIRTKIGKWDMDFNNTFGLNRFSYEISNTLNATLEENSPTSFDAGGHQLFQNTTSVNFNKYYDTVAKGLNIAFGSEYRVEKFKIFAGEEASYSSYDIFGNVVTASTPEDDYVVDEDGNVRPGGSQGFPGYSPTNVVNKDRSNISLYLDTDLDISDEISASAAVRYENYSDFGNALNVKWAQRFKLTRHNTFRYALSTGFRAPSLVQKYYNLQFTDFVGGVGQESLLVSNDNPIARAFGIEELKEEKSFNASAGYTFKKGGFTATLDGYFVKVKDRIVLTGQFDGTSISPELTSVQFFANGLDTQTTGLDIVISYDKNFNDNKFGVSLVGNINKMKVGKIKGTEILNSEEDLETFFGEREKYFLLASAPANKFGLNLNYAYKKLNTYIRFTRFGEVELIDWLDTVDHYGSKIVTDASLSYQFTKNVGLTVGANNLFNIYPDIQDTETETGGNFDSVQMGSNGMFLFTRLNIKF